MEEKAAGGGRRQRQVQVAFLNQGLCAGRDCVQLLAAPL